MNPLDPSIWNADLESIFKGHDHFSGFQNQDKYYSFEGLGIHCPPGIYKTTIYSTTMLMLRVAWNWQYSYKPHTILEIGSGSGALGLLLKSPNNHITLTDISPVAIEAIAENAEYNKIEVEVLQSDMFESVAGRQFDLIIFNVPFLNKSIENPADVALCDPDGILARRFLDELPHYLTPHGTALFAYSNVGHYQTLQDGLSKYAYNVEVADYTGSLRWYRWIFSLKKSQ